MIAREETTIRDQVDLVLKGVLTLDCRLHEPYILWKTGQDLMYRIVAGENGSISIERRTEDAMGETAYVAVSNEDFTRAIIMTGIDHLLNLAESQHIKERNDS